MGKRTMEKTPDGIPTGVREEYLTKQKLSEYSVLPVRLRVIEEMRKAYGVHRVVLEKYMGIPAQPLGMILRGKIPVTPEFLDLLECAIRASSPRVNVAEVPIINKIKPVAKNLALQSRQRQNTGFAKRIRREEAQYRRKPDG